MTATLSPAALCNIVRQSIDPDVGLKNQYEALAALANACMLNTGFKFIGLGEEGKVETSITSDTLSPLPSEWNSSASFMYAFRYTHAQSSMEYIIRVSRMGKKTMVFGIANGDDKTCSIDITTQDYTSENFYPWKPAADAEALANGYISMSRIKDFASLYKINVLQKLIPGLNKEGYSEERPVAAATRGNRPQGSSRPRDDPANDPLRDIPRPNYDPLRNPPQPFPRPSDWPPEFEDEHQMRGSMGGPRLPGAFGADDLNPPGIDAMNPFGRRSGGGHRGMHPTPEDIMFPDRGYGTPTFPSPGMPPAGARYDPVFPGDNNGMNSRRGPRHFGGGGPSGPMDNDVGNSMFG